MQQRRMRRRGGALVGALVVLTAVAAVPASQAARSHSHALHGPLARQLDRMAGAKAADQGEDADAAQEVLARAQYEGAIENAPAGSVSARALAAGISSARGVPVTGGRWRELTDHPYLDDPIPGYGPESYSNWGVGWGIDAGRMTGLAASGRAVYAGAADGGVWKSTDRGAHWKPWSNGLPRISVGDLQTNPRDGSVWVGLGEANTNQDAQAAFGVYRLGAGAGRWVRVGGRELMSRGIYHLYFDGRWAFAATQQGLYRHASAGASGRWQLVFRPDPNPTHSPYRNQVTDVVAVPGTAGRTVLANLGWRGGTEAAATAYNGFYVSTSWGRPGSFHKITPTGDINPAEIGRVSFSGTWKRGPLYAVVEDSATVDLNGEGVFVSPNGDPAGPWKLIADVPKLANSGSALSPDPAQYHPGIQAWYNQYVKVDPANPKHVYLGLEEVFETTNGGKTWFAIGAYWNYDIACAQNNQNPYNCPPTTHPDQHAIAFSHGQVYVGSDGGVWRRSMRAHWRPGWHNLSASLHTLQYYSVALGRIHGGNAVWGGMQDNGASLLLPSGRYLNQFTGDGGDTIVDPRNGARALNEYTDLDVTLTTDFGRHDIEISPSCLTAADPPSPCDENPQFIAPMERDPHNASHFVIGGQYVWESWKGWATRCAGAQCDWKIAHDVGAPGPDESTTAIGVSGKTVYAGWCAGSACNPHGPVAFSRGISTNVGGSWHELNVSGLPNRYITSLTVDPDNASHVYATFGSYSRRWIDGSGYGHVWESRDGGESWRNVSGNLPDVPAHKLALWGRTLVVGTDVGVFRASASTPKRWTRLGHDLPPSRVWDLAVSPGGRYLVAATHGRGQWAINRP